MKAKKTSSPTINPRIMLDIAGKKAGTDHVFKIFESTIRDTHLNHLVMGNKIYLFEGTQSSSRPNDIKNALLNIEVTGFRVAQKGDRTIPYVATRLNIKDLPATRGNDILTCLYWLTHKPNAHDYIYNNDGKMTGLRPLAEAELNAFSKRLPIEEFQERLNPSKFLKKPKDAEGFFDIEKETGVPLFFTSSHVSTDRALRHKPKWQSAIKGSPTLYFNLEAILENAGGKGQLLSVVEKAERASLETANISESDKTDLLSRRYFRDPSTLRTQSENQLLGYQSIERPIDLGGVKSRSR